MYNHTDTGEQRAVSVSSKTGGIMSNDAGIQAVRVVGDTAAAGITVATLANLIPAFVGILAGVYYSFVIYDQMVKHGWIKSKKKRKHRCK